MKREKRRRDNNRESIKGMQGNKQREEFSRAIA